MVQQFQIGRKRDPKRSKIRIKSNYEIASLEMKMRRMAQSGLGFWKILLTTALVVLFLAAFNASAVNVATIYVLDDYGTIQDAVDAASPGDTIHQR
jgi:hypothetical protein